MQKIGGSFRLSAGDLVGYLNCHHLTRLDRAVAEGTLAKPTVWDPLLDILRERGSIHEQNYVDHLTGAGLNVVRIDGVDATDGAVDETLAAMKDGVEVIVQGALARDGWAGRADILRRVESPSVLGGWSYEPVDTKLARETKAGTVLQLCLYADLLHAAQGALPEWMYVIAPWSDFEPQSYRFADYGAYYRQVKRGMAQNLAAIEAEQTYPDPIAHCDICRWRETCEKRRRDDDHLCLVAGISRLQINELKAHGVATMQGLAQVGLPLTWKPNRGSAEALIRVREQARIQVEARESGQRKFELLPVELGFGLARLPEPCEGDIFFDLEGDPFVGEHGQEYLFGYLFRGDTGQIAYTGEWAFTRADEKQAFERFIDFVLARWKAFPDLHIYHYAAYEPAALKRLMGRYASREDEIDRMLRAGLFVDLYQIVRHSIRASVESYSIKQMEPFHGFTREMPLLDANAALANLQADLELDDAKSIGEETKATVLAYNRDDCHAAAGLRDWLEEPRAEAVASGTTVPRPEPGDGAPSETVSEWLALIGPLFEKLTAGLPADPEERDDEQQGRWILANLLDYHRREEKSVWWELFRLSELPVEDLLDERVGLSGLTYIGGAGGTARAPIHRYGFPLQETELRGGEELRNVGGTRLGKVEVLSLDECTVDIKKRQDSAATHPQAVFAHKFVGKDVVKNALVRIGEYVADNGLDGDGRYQAARDLLLKLPPRIGGQALRQDGETILDAAVRLCTYLEGGVLPIQGPPGAGKTYTGAHMICELVRLGKKVGVTANSHKVIRNLLNGVIKLADQNGIDLHCCQKPNDMEDPQHRLTFAKRSEDLDAALGTTAQVGGGTAWHWAREEAFQSVDVLFVDEAAQMCLADVVAVSQAAETLVLIGDPQQLDQPRQGSHPDGTDVSPLDHILAGEQTIAPGQGLFLDETWRLHPDICAYTSELFYENKLRSKPGLEIQVINGATSPVSGASLRYLPVAHRGNQNSSPEEAQAVAALVHGILESKATWINRDGLQEPVTWEDIVIITPYNAQVFEIQERLPRARVGTVDKFQGQEAPIAIYSTATSSHADAPRGMEFLYSLNRLNVATSRAKCISIIVSAPALFEAECRTPRQIQLANAFCRFLELAEPIDPGAAG